MNRLGTKAAILGALVGSLAAAPSAEAFRAMTWNIRGSSTARAQAPPFSVDAVGTVVERYSPDILALQEVCSWQAGAIASSLGYAWHETAIARFDDARPGAGGRCDYGIALLSTTPIPEHGRYRTDLLAPAKGCKSDASQDARHPECRVNMGALIAPLAGPTCGRPAPMSGRRASPTSPTSTSRSSSTALLGDAERNEPVALIMGDYNVAPEDPRMAHGQDRLHLLPGAVVLGSEVVEPLVDGVEGPTTARWWPTSRCRGASSAPDSPGGTATDVNGIASVPRGWNASERRLSPNGSAPRRSRAPEPENSRSAMHQ